MKPIIIDTYEMAFDRWDGDHYVHATGREIGEYTYATDGRAKTFGWRPEYEDDYTVETPATDFVARVNELNDMLAEMDWEIEMAKYGDCSRLIPDSFYAVQADAHEELETLMDILYEWWDDKRLEDYNIVLPEELEQEMIERQEYEKYEQEMIESGNMPCDTFGPAACSTSCPRFFDCNG